MKVLLKCREVWLLAAIVVLIGLISMRFPGFAAFGNLRQVFNDTSILMILALGQMVVILTRSIDLSMAS
ncbi:MAG: ABC transporter permease, partial [Mesorhizobium sp.]